MAGRAYTVVRLRWRRRTLPTDWRLLPQLPVLEPERGFGEAEREGASVASGRGGEGAGPEVPEGGSERGGGGGWGTEGRSEPSQGSHVRGGEGIRTLGALLRRYGFQDRRHRPLGHSSGSVFENIRYVGAASRLLGPCRPRHAGPVHVEGGPLVGVAVRPETIGLEVVAQAAAHAALDRLDLDLVLAGAGGRTV